MKKQSFGIILAAVLGAGSLFSAVIPGTDALFNAALPGTGAVTVQAEASNSFGGSGSEEDDSYQDFAASEFSLVLDEADLLTDEEESQLLNKLEAITEEYNLEVAVATVESKEGNEMNFFTSTISSMRMDTEPAKTTTESCLWSALATVNGTLPPTDMV